MQQQIVIGRPSEPSFPPAVLDGVFRFRHRVFQQRLGWQVASRRGREVDDYDDLDPVYIACCDDRSRGSVIGTFRLLPTTGPYMLRDVFPELLRGEDAPCASDVWELSRFAVEPHDPSARVQASCSPVTLNMMRACYCYGVDNGIREYVMVTSVAVERMLRGMGLNLVRLGDGRSERLGKVRSVACRLTLDDALGQVLGVTERSAAQLALTDDEAVREAGRQVA